MTITVGLLTELSEDAEAGNEFSTAVLGTNKVLIAHRFGSDYKLAGLVCTISGTTITKSTDTILDSLENSGYSVSAVTMSSSEVWISHSYGSSYRLRKTTVMVNNASLTSDNSLISYDLYSGYAVSAVKLNENSMFVASTEKASNGYILCGMLVRKATIVYRRVASIESSLDKIAGLSCSSGDTGKSVQVIVPNV